MKATNLVRLVCVSCAWYAAGALHVKARAEPQARFEDVPITVEPPPGKQVAGIKGCLAPPAPTYEVRIQSLVTTRGLVYSRQRVTIADFPCFTSSVTETFTAATHFADCAEATAKKGLNSFMWEGGACTAFLAWRPRIRADCKDGGSKVVYVVDKPLTPFPGGAMQVSGEFRYDVPKSYLDISYQYEFCGFGEEPEGYKLQWNETNEVIVPKGTTAYRLDNAMMCFIITSLSLWSIGKDGNVNSNEFQLEIGAADSHWYSLDNGRNGCLYLGPTSTSYRDAIANCDAWGLPTLFSEKVDGEAMRFLGIVDEVNGLPTEPFWVGLEKNASEWIWTDGITQPDQDTLVWARGQPVGSEVCAAVTFTNAVRAITPMPCNNNSLVVCYVPNP